MKIEEGGCIMIIKLQGLSEEEKTQIFTLEDVCPDYAVREIEGSFDGLAIVELFIPVLVPAAVVMITAILAARRDSDTYSVDINGRKHTVKEAEEFLKLAKQ